MIAFLPAWLIVAAAVVLSSWWLVSYVRERDAGGATSRVVGGVGSLVVGLFAIASIALAEGASTLSLIGDMIGAHAPWIAHAVGTGLGYLALGGRIPITPRTWIVAMVAILLVLVMFDRGDR